MVEPDRILEPLNRAEGSFRTLSEYESAAELGGALSAVWEAIERSLRLLLRNQADIPDSLRLSALSAGDLPFRRVVEELRARNLIGFELAGLASELEQAVARARAGEVKAADADLARRTVDRLRADVRTYSDRGVRDAAHHAVEAGTLEDAATPVPPPDSRSSRRFALMAGAVAVVALIVLAIAMMVSMQDDQQQAIEAFEAGQMQRAESLFREVVADQPENVTAWLYLARIYRTDGRLQDAGEALRRARSVAPQDAAVYRELGYLFRDLDRPVQAAESFERAVELDPDEKLNWIGWVHALRATGDPTAEQVLRRAPDDVRAALTP